MPSIIDFSSPEFQKEAGSSTPFCQILNPKGSRSEFGFSITELNVERSGFQPPSDWKKSKYKFGGINGTWEEVYVTQTPRLLILGASNLFIRDREDRKKTELFDFNKYNKVDHLLYKRAWCFILDSENKLCHQEPMSLPLSGAAGTSFSCAWLTNKPSRSGFIKDMEELYASTRNIPCKVMGSLFHAHCVFEPIIELKDRGLGSNISEVSIVEEYKKPTIANNLIMDKDFGDLIKLSVEDVKQQIKAFEARVLKGEATQEASEDVAEDEMPW